MIAVLVIVGMITIISLGISFGAIPSTLMAAANAYGLFLLIAMLGHGLVNVPRRLWRSSLRQLNLKRYQFDIAVLDAKLLASTEELSKTLLVKFFRFFPIFFPLLSMTINCFSIQIQSSWSKLISTFGSNNRKLKKQQK